MSLKSLITAALLIGSTTSALAVPITDSSGPTVRDHRAYPQRAPHVAHIHVGDRPRLNAEAHVHDGWGRNTDAIRDTLPVLEDAIECRNWDPIVDGENARCGIRAISVSPDRYDVPGIINLGSRDSSVAGNQFITVEQSLSRVHVRTVAGRPHLTKVQVRYMDGTADVIHVSPRMLSRGLALAVRHQPIDQLIFYTTSGSHGVYAVSGS